jgi:chloramphenicol 3-O phosphotransferase
MARARRGLSRRAVAPKPCDDAQPAVPLKSRIVLLNGVGSSGKSSIAKALQQIASEPFLHVAMDAFIDMLPASSFNQPDGITFGTTQQHGKPVVIIHTGPVAARALRGMRHAVVALAAQGNNLILDDVLLGEDKAAEYAQLLRPFDVFLVGVFAPLDVLEARERQRGDRLIGLARWQFDRVHRGIDYDLEVDASTASAMACAELIKQRFRL